MLEDLEVIPAAFDHLKLPYQIVKGSVGRLEAQASFIGKEYVLDLGWCKIIAESMLMTFAVSMELHSEPNSRHQAAQCCLTCCSKRLIRLGGSLSHPPSACFQASAAGCLGASQPPWQARRREAWPTARQQASKPITHVASCQHAARPSSALC